MYVCSDNNLPSTEERIILHPITVPNSPYTVGQQQLILADLQKLPTDYVRQIWYYNWVQKDSFFPT